MGDIPIFGTIEALPRRIGRLWLADVEIFEDTRAGVCFRYRYPEKGDQSPIDESDNLEATADRLSGPKPDFRLVKADVYLYNLGLSTVPVDLASDDMHAIFQDALADIAHIVNQGRYEQFEVMTSGLLNALPDTAEPTWLWAAMRYRQVKGELTDYDQDRVSHIALRTDDEYINKVRYTYPAILPTSLAYSDFLLFLFEWKHSIKRVLAGKGAIPEDGDFNDPEWVRGVTEFRATSLPHPLYFFDPTAAMVRQSELVEDHLQVQADSPERALEKHEFRETLHHEVAHAVFSILEREMPLEIEIGGFGNSVDIRKPPNSEEENTE